MATSLGSATGTGSTGSFTVAANVNVGDTIIGQLLTSATSPTVTISDSGGNSYGFDIAVNANGNCVFRVIATAALVSGTGTLSFNSGTSGTYCFSAMVEAGGWAPDGTVPAFTAVTNTGTSAPSCTVPTAGDLLYATASMYASGTFTATVASPFTLLTNPRTSPRSEVSAFLESASAGTVTATFTWNQAHSQSSVLIPYKAVTSGVTGTSAQTLPHLTQAAAGTTVAPSFTGSAAQTLRPLTQAAAGTATPPAFVGTAAQTLGPLTQAAAGTSTPPAFTGTAADTLPPLTQAASGGSVPPSFAADAAQTLPPLSQAAAGAVVNPGFSGSAAQTLPPLAQDAAGTRTVPNFDAAAAQTLPALTQAADGAATGPAFTGSIAQTLPKLRQKARQNPPPRVRAASVGLPLTSSRSGPPQTKSVLGRPLTRSRVGAVMSGD